MITGLKGGSISQYLVLVEPALGSTDGASLRGKGGIPLTAAASKSIPLSSFGVAYADSKSSISGQTSGTQNSPISSSYNDQIKDLFWQNVDSSNKNNGKITKNVYNSVSERRNDFYESFKKYVENKIQKGKNWFYNLSSDKVSYYHLLFDK